MERWASRTLRVVGIVLISSIVAIIGLTTTLFTLCMFAAGTSRRDADQLAPLVAVGCGIVIVGVFALVWLAKGYVRGTRDAADMLPTSSRPAVPLHFHFSSRGRRSLNFLIGAIAAEICGGTGVWLWVVHSWLARQPYFAHILTTSIWWKSACGGLVLGQLPYLILLFFLFRRPDHRTFAYALAVPSVEILNSLYSIMLLGHLGGYSRYWQLPFTGDLAVSFGFGIAVAILYLAIRANNIIGYKHETSSLLVAGLVVFIYLYLLQFLSPLLFKFL